MSGSSHSYQFLPLGQLKEDEFRLLTFYDTNYFPFPWTVSQWSEAKVRQEYYCALSFVENQLVTFSFYQLNLAEAFSHLLKILVLPEQRGKGFGAKHLQADLEELKALKVEQAYLEVESTNSSALQLYQLCGFKELALKKNFYGVGRHAVSMSQTLI